MQRLSLEAQRVAEVLADRGRSVLVAREGLGGRSVTALAVSLLSRRSGRQVSVFSVAARRLLWVTELGRHGTAGDPVCVSPQVQARRPELLDPEDILLLDSEDMTLTRDTASWRAFAPRVRAAHAVVMFAPFSRWPQCVHQVELVCPFDQVTLLEQPALCR